MASGKTYVNPEHRDLLLVNRIGKDIDKVPAQGYSHTQTLHAFADTNRFEVLSPDSIYSFNLKKPFKEIPDKPSFYAQIFAEVFVFESPEECEFSLITSFEHKGRSYKFRGKDSDKIQLKRGQWNTIQLDYLSPSLQRRSDNIKSFVWYRGQDSIYVRDIRVKVFEKDD